ncbi:MAG: radical SAM protein [bacterium]|nr:radical SAM protein [bacterium]
MKVALINPHYFHDSIHPEFNAVLEKSTPFSTSKTPSLPLLAVAALTPPEFEVSYIDENTEPVDFDMEVDLVGISALTPQATRAYEIADSFRKRGKKVVLGGVHASILSKEAKNHADAVVIGEAENVWGVLLEDFQKDRLKEFYTGGLADMKKILIPRFDLLKSHHYMYLPTPVIPMEFSRGCPIDCTFCNVTRLYGAKTRYKEPIQIKNEIEYLLEDCSMGSATLKFNDPNPFVNQKAAAPILETIGEFNLKWASLADISIAKNSDFLKLMKKSGCFLIAIGLESLVSEELKDLSEWKERYVEKYVGAIKKINDHGIAVVTNIIISPGPYTRRAVERTIEFVDQYKVLAQYSILTPYPGTHFYEEVQSQGKIKKDLDWKYFNTFNLVYDSGYPPEELYEGIEELYRITWSKDFMKSIHSHNQAVWA